MGALVVLNNRILLENINFMQTIVAVDDDGNNKIKIININYICIKDDDQEDDQM